jgi:HSP20 family protein
MTLIKWQPLKMFNWQNQWDNWLDAQVRGAWSPVSEVRESKDRYTIYLELPGVKKEDLKIDLADDVLTIQGEKRDEKELADDEQRSSERFYGSFTRSFALPGQVAADQIKAEYRDGVLLVTVPKSEQAKVKQININ